MIHPDDDNGDALRRLEADGDDLSRARDIDFSVVFPSASAAGGFAEYIRAQGYTCSEYFSEDVNDFPWNVKVVKHMAPSYEQIVSFEDFLQNIANTFGGHNDGWGCFSEPASQ